MRLWMNRRKRRDPSNRSVESNDNQARAGFAYDSFASYSTRADYGLVGRFESFLESFHKLPVSGDVALHKLSKAVEEPDSEWAVDLIADDKSDVGVRLAFSQDGTRIVAATGSSMQVFDAKHGNLIGPRVDLPGRVMHIALDKHGLRAVASLATFQQSVVVVSSGEISETHFFASDRVGDWSVVVADDETSIYSVFDDPNIKHPRVSAGSFRFPFNRH